MIVLVVVVILQLNGLLGVDVLHGPSLIEVRVSNTLNRLVSAGW